VRKADNLTTFMCRCLEIWEPQPPGTLKGLSRPVMGLLFAYKKYDYLKTYKHSNGE